MIASLAWRNIWRNKTRSLVVITAIALGIVSALVLDSFYLGMVKTFIKDSINKTTAHIQIHTPAFLEDEDVRYVLTRSDLILADLDSMAGVQASTSRVIVNAMMSTSRTSLSLKVKGVDPQRETGVSDLRPYLVEGDYFEGEMRNPILISTLVAEKADIRMGAKVVLTFQDMTGEITSGLFRVSGLFDTGSDIVDQSMGFVAKEDLIRTIDPTGHHEENFDHEIAILLDDINAVTPMADRLNKSYPDIKAETYREISPELDLYESQIDTMTWFYFLIIMAALIFGIINTMLMAVLERYKEFGVLMSLGMARIKLFVMVILETLSLCLTAAPIGILLGLLVIYILSRTGIDLSMWSEFLEQYGMASMIYPEINPTSFRRLIIAIVITAILAAIYPAWKAIRLNPLDAIRKI